MTTRQTATQPTMPVHPMLKVIREIVAAAGQAEAFETAEEFRLSIENAPYMRLVIESHPASDALGTSTEARRFISIAHYPERQGPWEDATCDTDLELLDNGALLGLTVAYGTHYTRVLWRGENGRVYIAPQAKREVSSFARMWARNLRAQGFIRAAKAMNQASAPSA